MLVNPRWSSTAAGSRGRFLLIAVIAMVSAVGCGKIPSWDEMTGNKPAPAPVKPAASPSMVEIPPSQPAAAPQTAHQQPDAAQTLAWFKALQPGQINDQSLIQLTSIPSGLEAITEINAQGSGVTDAGLALLAKLPALQKLSLDGTAITDEGMKGLQRVPSLQSLSLSATRISAGGLERLATLPGLKQMQLMGCNLTQADFAAIGKLPALETLVLNRVLELNDAGLDLICEASTLKTLYLNECVGLTDKGLVALAKAPGLEELYLNRSNITGVGLGAAVAKRGLKSLKVLAVSAAPINLPGAKAINSLRTLESLDIGFIGAMNDVFFVEFVEGLPHLKSLNIEASKGLFGNGFAKIKSTANSLETLNAQNSSVVDQAFVFLRGHKKLKFLDLSNTNVTLTGVQQFKKVVPTCVILYAGVRY
jgi:Leucine-rich repeat (LRR) protein